MKKMSLRPMIILTAICILISALLAVINMITFPIIQENAEKKRTESLHTVMPAAKDFIEVDIPEGFTSIVGIFEESSGLGYAVLLETSSQYSSENMGITVAVSKEGTVSSISLTSYYESKNFGKTEYPATFIGKDSSLEGVDTVSGVTFSSTAFKNAVQEALLAVDLLNK